MALEASIRIIYDRRKKASATVKGGVEIEVYYNRQRIRFATGVNVLKQQWKGGMVANHPDAHKLNEQIINLYETIDQRMATMRRRGVIDLNLLKQAKEEEECKSSNFFDGLFNVTHVHVYGISFSKVDTPYFKRIAEVTQDAKWEFSDYEGNCAQTISSFIKRHSIKSYLIIELKNLVNPAQLKIEFPKN